MSLLPSIQRTIRQSETRSRRQYAYDAAEYIERHSILLGLLNRFVRVLEQEVTIQNLIYVLHRNEEVAAIISEGDKRKFSIIERKVAQFGVLAERFNNLFDDADMILTQVGEKGLFSSNREDPINVVASMAHLEPGSDIVLLRFSRLPRVSIDDPIATELAGFLVLGYREKEIRKSRLESLFASLRTEFSRYADEIGYIYQLDRDFLISRLINIGESLEESASHGMIYGTRLLHHRFGTLRQVAESISTYFDTAEKVIANSADFEQRMQNLKHQMESAKRLSEVLEILGEDHQFSAKEVDEALDIFKFVYDQALETAGVGGAALKILIEADEIGKRKIIPPYRLLDEVFRIQIDNCLREIKKPRVTNKDIDLVIRESRDYVYFDIKNYGPPIPDDIYEDVRNAKQVKRAQGSGLGVFLSTHIMSLVGGRVYWYSPLEQGIGTQVTLGFKKVN